MIIQHKQNCDLKEKTSIWTSSESHLHWKNYFHKNPSYFRIIADFESEKEVDKSRMGIKTANIYEQKSCV